MDASDYKKMAEQLLDEVASLEIQQEETNRRIARLKKVLIDLAPLAEESIHPFIEPAGNMSPEADSVTITDATRQILQVAKIPMGPADIRQQLLKMGVDLGDQKNVMAGIHSLLKRLVASGEIETLDNGLTYQWNGIRVLVSTPEARTGYVDHRRMKKE
jgi:hypothetical protein